MAHGSYHTPFIGNGRNAWDAWQMGKPWSAAGHAGLFGVEALGMRSAGKVRGAVQRGGVAKARKSGTVIKQGKVAGAKAVPRGKKKELFNFTETTLKHMENPDRRLPVSILDNAIKSTKGLPDPQSTKALMHYTQITRNGKKYNLEVLYDKSINEILHFKYSRDAMGPLKEIPK